MKVKKMRMLLQKKFNPLCPTAVHDMQLNTETPNTRVNRNRDSSLFDHAASYLCITFSCFFPFFQLLIPLLFLTAKLCSCAVLGKGKLPRCPWLFWVTLLIHRYLSEINLMLEKCKIELTCKKRINNEIRLRSEPKD